ncbi:flagellar export chaperone FliS [Alteribacillus sp. YIM 98480]|uniref:flagellar export chaperone FliS n=1 Tax=Alteribacillus sp. YIM 98480 TaxID=2606599 RepID=UPI00131C9035|nr:flagellar export chaperone FliS [Alteribacillus sp. YIM 98480]
MTFLSDEILQQKTSQELTMMLYEACEQSLEEAISSIEKKDYMLANKKFQRAVDILERLGVGLNYDAGIIADELDALYNYMSELLIIANIEKNIEKAKEAASILHVISAAWNEAILTQTDKQSKTVRARKNAYEKNALYAE